MPTPDKSRRRFRRTLVLAIRYLTALALLVILAWSLYVIHRINLVAHDDQARTSDAIAVFGAAEYSGRPSPIYHLRLDHAVSLYRKQIATLVITLGGGADKSSGITEGGVGRDYLLAHGIPYANILAETNSFSTAQQVRRLAELMHDRHLHTVVVVSDPTHMFRIQQLCQAAGLTVFTSPRAPLGHIDNWDLSQRYLHEILSYTSQRLHLHEGRIHRWLDGHNDT